MRIFVFPLFVQQTHNNNYNNNNSNSNSNSRVLLLMARRLLPHSHSHSHLLFRSKRDVTVTASFICAPKPYSLSYCDTSAREPHQLTSESKLCVAFSRQTLTNLSKSICNEPTNATTATRRWLGCVLK